jgi:uncharacterized repeat protein (TIGR03803 family)
VSGYTRRGVRSSLRFLIGASLSLSFCCANEIAAANKFKVLYSFCTLSNCLDGDGSISGLVRDTSGNLYGSTRSGGVQGQGTLVELSREPGTAKWTERVIHDFCAATGGYPCPDGFNPSGPLIIDASGNLYGTTLQGGNDNDAGIAFELMPNADHSKWTLKVLHTFCSKKSAQTDCADGYSPNSGLAYQGQTSAAPYDGTSPLYGTAENAGHNLKGLAFEFAPIVATSNWKEKVIYNFCSLPNCADGNNPRGKLAIDAKGDLFGVAIDDENPDPGVAYELLPKKGRRQESVLHKFCQQQDCTDGVSPNPLAIDGQGTLYGTTLGGGEHDWGTIFKIVPAGANSSYQVLYNFCSQANCADGGAPVAGVTLDSQGNLYGPTGWSEEPLPGTIFRYSQDGTLTTLHTFCSGKCKDGEYPESELLLGPHNAIYGTTVSGGKQGNGTAFQLNY